MSPLVPSCVWVRPQPLTELYGCIALASLVVLACVFVWSRRRSTASSTIVCAPLCESTSGRDEWVDCVRLVLTFFILTGHLAAIPCSYVPERTYWFGPFLVWTNLIAIPGFATLSGHLSKAPLTEGRASRLVIYVVLPYLFIKFLTCVWTAWTLRAVMFANPLIAFNPFDSEGNEWYLACLIQWRLALVVFQPLGRWPLVLVALVVGLMSGFWVPESSPGSTLRACSFFPFFAAGYAFDLGHVRKFLMSEERIAWKLLFRAVFLCTLGLLFLCPAFSGNFVTYSVGDLNFDYTTALPYFGATAARPPCGSEFRLSILHRLVRYELMVVMVVGLIAWVPSSPAMAYYGRNVMYPYLLHNLVLAFVAYSVPLSWWLLSPFTPGGWTWGSTLVIGPVLTLTLASAPVRLLARGVIEPTWASHWIFTPKNAAQFVVCKSAADGDLLPHALFEKCLTKAHTLYGPCKV